MIEKEGKEKDIEILKEIIEIKIEKEKREKGKEGREIEETGVIGEIEEIEMKIEIEIWKEKEMIEIRKEKEGILIMIEKMDIEKEKEINYYLLLNYEVIVIFSFIFYVMENEILFKWLLEIELQCNVFIVYF